LLIAQVVVASLQVMPFLSKSSTFAPLIVTPALGPPLLRT
jgi:hypothetical protein